MKTTLLLFAALFFMSARSFATVHTITVSNDVFTPNAIPNVHLGDTVTWTWLSGSHTTTSTSVPAGAVTWDHAMNSGSTTFTYVPAVVGTYSYECTFHASMGMTGTFNVITGTNVSAVQTTVLAPVYPNPVSETLHVMFNATAPANVTLTDMAGNQVITEKFNGTSAADINLRNIATGNYIVRIVQGTDVSSQQLVVRH